MGLDEKASRMGGHVWSKHRCWQRLQKMYWRARASHKLYCLGNGLLTVVVVGGELREGYSTWEMSEEVEKQNNCTLVVNVCKAPKPAGWLKVMTEVGQR